jgi:hypothetical protein
LKKIDDLYRLKSQNSNHCETEKANKMLELKLELEKEKSKILSAWISQLKQNNETAHGSQTAKLESVFELKIKNNQMQKEIISLKNIIHLQGKDLIYKT